MRNRITHWSGAVVGSALLVVAALGMITPHSPQAQSAAYTFTLLATLNEPAPGGGFHINDFEPGALNNRGDFIYGTDLGTSPDPNTFFGEGVFLRQARQASTVELARSTGPAPGGGVFDFLLLGQTALNDQGDAAFAFTLVPFSTDGVSSGLYRYSHSTGQVTPVVVSGSPAPPPVGGSFAGVGFNVSLTNRGDLVFNGVLPTGVGVFKADKRNQITSVVSPGDVFPGGGEFVSIGNGGPRIAQGGDVAFTARLAGEDSALSSVYVKNARTQEIISVAHAGDREPCGGVFRSAYSPVLNNRSVVVFFGDISQPPDFFQSLGLYRYLRGETVAVACPGDPMPGGGHFVRTSTFTAEQVSINNSGPGEIVFNALLDTVNGEGVHDTGLYVWSRGSLRLVARTGTIIPGVGTVSQLAMPVITGGPPPISFLPDSGAINNDRGQVLLGATLTDGRAVLLLATP